MPRYNKPKTSSPIYSEARLVLLREPWLTYPQAWAKMTTSCVAETVSVYGGSIRHEIGCEIRSVGGKERLEVDYDKYVAACTKYAVRPFTAKSLVKQSTANRQVVIKDVQVEVLSDEEAKDALDKMSTTLNELAGQLEAETINLPPYNVVVESLSLGGDVKAKKAKLNKAFEEAELRMSEASAKVKELETLREMLLTQISKQDERIAAQRQVIDEATQAMDVMLTLVDAPDAVIDLVL